MLSNGQKSILLGDGGQILGGCIPPGFAALLIHRQLYYVYIVYLIQLHLVHTVGVYLHNAFIRNCNFAVNFHVKNMGMLCDFSSIHQSWQ